jgi:hypothetical protein
VWLRPGSHERFTITQEGDAVGKKDGLLSDTDWWNDDSHWPRETYTLSDVAPWDASLVASRVDVFNARGVSWFWDEDSRTLVKKRAKVGELGRVPVPTWKVNGGSVRLQPNFDNYAETPWPDGSRGVNPFKEARPDAAGDDVPMRRPKPKVFAQWSEGYFIFLQLAFYASSSLALGYVPRSGKGNRKKGESAFLSAWLHEHDAKGWPRKWLEDASGRQQQSVSQLILQHRERLVKPEAEPWLSRRKSRGSVAIFHPNYSTDPNPPKEFYEGKESLTVEVRSTRVRSAPDTPDTDAHGAGFHRPARASLLEELSATSAHVSRRVIPRRRPNVRPIIDHRAATASEDR